MSLHNDQDDVEIQTAGPGINSDARVDSNIEPLECSGHENSVSTVATRTSRISISTKKLCAEIWRRSTRWFIDWWMGELLAIFLSLSAFSALIFVLLKYDGHMLPTLPHNVPLSFIVATLAAVSKSSLLLVVSSAFGQFKWLWISSKKRRLQDLQDFDEASRGPLGAAKLLTSSKGLSWASIGSFITILCLVFDPFVQGLIRYTTRVDFKDDSTILLPRIDYYPDSYYFPHDPTILFNIYNAAISSNPLSETKPSCPTGNCTWPPFTSLGFCSKCEDISRLLQNNITHGVEYFFCGDSWKHTQTSDYCDPSIRNYTYTFPKFNGQFLSIDDWATPASDPSSFNVTLARQSFENFQVNPFLTFSMKSSLRFNFTDGTLTSGGGLIVFIRLNGQDPGIGDVLQADLCALSYCAQKRHVSVTLNQFSSTILQTVYGNPITDKTVLRKYPYNNTVLSFIGDDFNITFPPLPIQPYYDVNTYRSELTEDDTLKGASTESWENNMRFLMNQFQDKITPGFPFPKLYDSGNETNYEDPHDVLRPQAAFHIIDAFKASSNIPMMMENIATALTNVIRDSSNFTVVGQVGQTHIYVTVIWPWIALPAFLVIASIIFLMLAMYESKRNGARVWRTSELALLFHGRKVWDEEGLQALRRVSDMERAASEIQVQMVKKSDGEWILQREREKED